MLQTYQAKQKGLYFQYLAAGRKESALDALWRAASDADLLEGVEISHERLTPERRQELLKQLGWNA